MAIDKTELFISKANKIHLHKYDYTKVVYEKSYEKVIIICSIHGSFDQRPANHLKGNGCPICGDIQNGKNRTEKKLLDRYKNIVQPLEYKLIPIHGGKYSKVDNEDYEMIKAFNWHFSRGYAVNNKVGFMHRLILNPTLGTDVDHIYHDKLDNRKSKLRLVTNLQNIMNRSSNPLSSSKYKGVSWSVKSKKWQAKIGVNYKSIFLGYYIDEKMAATAYNNAAIKYFGEYAYLNYI